MNRIGTSLLLVVPLLLSGCGGSSNETTYAFQMGRQSATHITAAMKLTKEDYSIDGKKVGQKLTYYMEARMGSASSSSAANDGEESAPTSEASVLSSEAISSASESESSVEESSSFDFDFKKEIMEMLAEGISLDGWYEIGAENEKGRKEMTVGFDLSGIIGETGSDIKLEPEVLEKIIYSETDGGAIYLSIPVSLDDLVYQLYWYGFDLDNFADVTEHKVGTHPTSEQVAEINKTYPASHGDRLYRDFHCLSLALKKQ